jgi:phosphonate transport system substrate-binding protein
MTSKTLFLALIILSLIFLGIVSCEKEEESVKISFKERETITIDQKKTNGEGLRIAVGGMVTPREGYAYYRQLLDYIGKKMGIHVKFVDREDYAQINTLVKEGRVDVAFVCGGPYVDGHREFGMKLLVAPQVNGESVYYSYIIVAKESPIKSFEELRGKIFAFTDPLSNTGKLVPTYMLAQMNETPETFFKRFFYTKSHDKSIEAVALGVADGAAVDSLIWEYANRNSPKYTSRTRIIKKSPPYGIPPVVVRANLDPKIEKKLRKIFLNMHKDPEGRKILDGMMIDKFVLIDDSAYDSIREMKAWIKRTGLGNKD